jgi:uroporphyrinogen decarboxylase
MPSTQPPDSNAWGNGIDEFGRVWHDGMYHNGMLKSAADIDRFTPPTESAADYFDAAQIATTRQRYSDHCLIFGAHIGPFMGAYMSMGIDHFFYQVIDDPIFVRTLMEVRTDWAIAIFREAIRHGAEVVVVGDDAAYGSGSMIAPALWRKLVLPGHRRLVEALDVPVIWHSDGDVAALLPMAVEAGFVGFHGLEPAAAMDLAAVKQAYGDSLTLIGNVDAQVLCDHDLAAVRREVDRSLVQGGETGYMFASCNSIFDGMNPDAVREMYRYVDAQS